VILIGLSRERVVGMRANVIAISHESIIPANLMDLRRKDNGNGLQISLLGLLIEKCDIRP
jgi:hypothetical protein